MRFMITVALCLLLAAPAPTAQDRAKAPAPAPAKAETTKYNPKGIVDTVEKLGAEIPEGLTFYTVDRKPVDLRKLIDKPTIINLVYISCPSICSPLMRELREMVNRVDMELGREYQVLTVSFDHREHLPEKNGLVRNAQVNLLKEVKGPKPEGCWRVLTGPKETIHRLCDLLGFYFVQNKTGDYDHAAATIFISTAGKVTRYLHGIQLLPANVQMALVDTMAGRERSTMRKIQKLCFSYDPEGGQYVLQVNKIILALSVVLVAIFLFFLFRARKQKPQAGGGEK